MCSLQKIDGLRFKRRSTGTKKVIKNIAQFCHEEIINRNLNYTRATSFYCKVCRL